MSSFQIGFWFLLLAFATKTAAQGDIFEVAENLGCVKFIDWVNRSSFIPDSVVDDPGISYFIPSANEVAER